MKPNYNELLKEREQLSKRIQEAETELSELRKQLENLNAEIEAAKVQSVSLSLEEKVDLFCSLFCGREDVFAHADLPP